MQGMTPLDAAAGSSRHVIMMLGGKNDACAKTQRLPGINIAAGALYAIRVTAFWLQRRLW